MRKDLIVIAVIVATLALMVVPLSQAFIDVLLALNISLSILLLMVAVYLRHPSDFATFPSVILLGTAFRLAMSVGTTRLILSDADAGQIIETFGEFVISGSVVIGLVIFLIITVVQFLVVTKGAERVAEVGARFALDALPGKQMSIDAEARAGDISAEEARKLRERLNKDSQFFGAMDGAMKFVKGDAIAGLIIIFVNLLGGILVGVNVHHLSFAESVQTYSLLTVGDGLVAQIPALLMALCAGVIVTRAANEDNDDLGSDISDELIADPRVPLMAACIVVAVGFIPGFPTLVFIALAMVLVLIGLSLRRARKAQQSDEDLEFGPEAEEDDFAVTDALRLVISSDIAETIDLPELEEQITQSFKAFYDEVGIPFPRPKIEISEALSAGECLIILDDVPVFKTPVPGKCIFLPKGGKGKDIYEVIAELNSPILSGYWVSDESAQSASELGFTINLVEDVLAQLAYGYYQRNLSALFTIQLFKEVHQILRNAEPEGMSLIDEEVEEVALYKILKTLVEEGVPIRPYSLFVNSLYYWMATQESPTSKTLAEGLRGSFKRQLCNRISQGNTVLGIALISPEIEQRARMTIAQTENSDVGSALSNVFLPLEDATRFVANMRTLIAEQEVSGSQLAFVISADLRRRLGNFLALNDIHVPILAPHEVSEDIPCLPVTVVTLGDDASFVPDQEADKPSVEFFDSYRLSGQHHQPA